MAAVQNRDTEDSLPATETTVEASRPGCNACMARYSEDELVQTSCTHRYCSECLKLFFTRAMKDETLYSPKCCTANILLRLASERLSKSFVRRYKAKRLELKTRNKTYCHRPTCSNFIAPHSIHNGHACCQRCGSITCAYCKSAWHWGRCSEEDGTGFFEFVKATEWKRCPECKRMVEKNDGCNHIVCRCGNNFCYGCGRNYDLCDCDSDEDMNEDEGCGFGLFD